MIYDFYMSKIENNVNSEQKNTLIEFLESNSNQFNIELEENTKLINEYEEIIYEKEIEIKKLVNKKKKNLELFSPNSNNNSVYQIEAEIIKYRSQIQNLRNRKIEIESYIKNYRESAQCIAEYQKLEKSVKEMKNDTKIKNDIGINLLEAQENERQRIARDLHDSTVQVLTSLIHKSELCARLIDIDLLRAKLELNTMSNTIKSVINEMREIIYNLRPMSLDDLGLVDTIERYVKQIMLTHDIKIVVHKNNEMNNLLPVIKVTIFRIIQEACNNAIKHAKATKIDIDLKFDKDDIITTIKDNGMGFDLQILNENSINHISKFGLSIMKERIFLLSGTIDIKSQKNKGTIIMIKVPLATCGGMKIE